MFDLCFIRGKKFAQETKLLTVCSTDNALGRLATFRVIRVFRGLPSFEMQTSLIDSKPFGEIEMRVRVIVWSLVGFGLFGNLVQAGDVAWERQQLVQYP